MSRNASRTLFFSLVHLNVFRLIESRLVGLVESCVVVNEIKTKEMCRDASRTLFFVFSAFECVSSCRVASSCQRHQIDGNSS